MKDLIGPRSQHIKEAIRYSVEVYPSSESPAIIQTYLDGVKAGYLSALKDAATVVKTWEDASWSTIVREIERLGK